MSRQFRSDDTVKWKYGFGKGSYDATISANETASWNGSTRFQAQGSIAGTAGNTSFTKPSGWAHAGLCLLHQTRGTGAGNWELAYVDFSGTNAVADQPLQNSYTTGAQIITLSNGTTGYNNLTINSGVTFFAPEWNGTTGGVVAILAKGAVTINGTLNVDGRGFAGGQADPYPSPGGTRWFSGEGTHGASIQSKSPGGNAGGGGYEPGGNSGAGGGNGTAGSRGGGSEDRGIGGAAVGNAELTSIQLGGGGGAAAAGGGDNRQGLAGAKGAGAIFIFANDITVNGIITLDGNTSESHPTHMCGGGGAGGSCLLKCVAATLGNGKIGAAAGAGGSGFVNGGNGGVGRIHIDYSGSISGTTTPTLSSRLDSTIKPAGGGGNMFLAF